MRKLLTVLTLFVLASCDNPFGTDNPTMTGEWGSEDGDISFTAKENEDGTFVGGGTIDYRTRDGVPIEVRGVNAYPSVTMTVRIGPDSA